MKDMDYLHDPTNLTLATLGLCFCVKTRPYVRNKAKHYPPPPEPKSNRDEATSMLFVKIFHENPPSPLLSICFSDYRLGTQTEAAIRLQTRDFISNNKYSYLCQNELKCKQMTKPC